MAVGLEREVGRHDDGGRLAGSKLGGGVGVVERARLDNQMTRAGAEGR